MTEPWSFNQPVLLKKTHRNSSVLVWTLVGATGFAGLWAFLAPLPETVAVQGKLQPSSAVHNIEAPLGGVVKQVLVQEGQSVDEGDLLIRFDARKAQAGLDSALSKRNGLKNQLAINRALVGDVPPADLSANQSELLDTRRQEFEQRNIANDEALARSQARISGLQQSVKAAEIVADRYESLMKLGAASELQVIEQRTKAETFRSNLKAEKREYRRLLSVRSAEASQQEAQRRREIEDIQRTVDDLDREIRQAEVVLSDIDITAPVAGLVFDLSVQRGSVIQPSTEAKPLLKLIPQDDLQAKIYIPNSAIGFIQPGQRADISLNSFNAGDYGYLAATVKSVGSDALTPDEQRQVLGTDASGLHFPATLQLSSQTLAVGKRAIQLQPGMSLTADLHLRTRRFISSITDLLEDKRRSLERMR